MNSVLCCGFIHFEAIVRKPQEATEGEILAVKDSCVAGESHQPSRRHKTLTVTREPCEKLGHFILLIAWMS